MSWSTAKLSEVATIERNSVAPEAITTGTIYVGLEHIASGGERLSPVQVAAGELSSNKFAFDATTILFGKLRPYLAKVVAPSFSGVCSTDILPIRPHENLDKQFLLHFLLSPMQVAYATNRATGANLPRLSPKELADIVIPLPPLDEQRRIAGILDAADALRRLRREALDLLDTLPGAIFAEMFGEIADLPSIPFGHVIHDIGNGVSPSRAGTVEDEVLTLSAVTGVSFDASKRKTDKFAGAIPAGKRIETGDFRLCRGNGNPNLVGSGKLADETGKGFVYPDTIMRAKLNESLVVPGYIASLWKHNHIRDQVTAGARTTNGTMKINQTTVKNIEIPLPDLASQTEFARRSIEIETAIKVHQLAHLSAIENLFASLQARAFAGEL